MEPTELWHVRKLSYSVVVIIKEIIMTDTVDRDMNRFVHHKDLNQ